ncbi:MAG TPA: hypothetical protein PLM53_14920 [Spirochaetota bacterium]|nr:hypothetical protein [Spirochaetota bacterium]HPC42023.1 hypothetical protein [Spirochaetota bacterium]HPL17882.1 hypothetical protein [Spirochaetota bacterium]HQF09540.1 hypothetical protein [Spirochaetota bacterium]HQH98390.1 hypothetical protein [Spirochaetota bacterium]
MKSGKVLVSLSIMLAMALAGCVTTVYRPAVGVIGTEDAAVEKLGDDIRSIRLVLKDKKIGIFYFTTLDWQIIDAGKRISGKLIDYLTSKRELTIIPRIEADAKMKTQAIEQARIFDIDAMRITRRELPVDVIVIGTLMQDMGTVRIELKAIDVATGRLMLVSGVRMPASGEFSAQEKPELTALYKKSPEKIMVINRTYFLLQWMKEKQPLVFLLAVVGDSEMKALRSSNAVLTEKLDRRRGRYQQERPDVMKKIISLQEGLSLMERYDQQRFGEIMKLKKELLGRMK